MYSFTSRYAAVDTYLSGIPLTSQEGGVTVAASGLSGDCDIRVSLLDDKLFISRDRFGRLPLFYYQTGETVWFSTRLDLLAEISGAPRELSMQALHAFTAFSWLPAPLTPFASIAAIPPGKTATFTLRESLFTPPCLTNWSSDWGASCAETSNLDSAASTLSNLLLEEAGRQTEGLRGEPVGVFLSGGLDSSIVASSLVRSGATVRAYCIDFGAFGRSEIEYAESVAAHLNIPLTRVPVGPREIRHAVDPVSDALDIPYGDGVTVPLFLAGQAAREECSIVFNGEGGDQLFAGWTNKPLFAESVYGRGTSLTDAYLRTFHRFLEIEASALRPDAIRSTWREALREIVSSSLEPPSDKPSEALMHRLRRANLKLKGSQNIQPRASSLALSAGLRVRSLFCSPGIADWTFSLKPEWFLQNSHEKYVLKLAVNEWLPGKIVWREKRGMGVPLTAWLCGPLWKYLGRWLHPRLLDANGFWMADLPLRLATGRLSGQVQGRRIGELLWLVVAWQAWGGARSKGLSPYWLPSAFWRSANVEIARRFWRAF